ncbi:MAG: hypothetical protein JSU98_12880 [Gemmatimonadales bacterium]|nr:MAG: hypothetical protein JSU98_12880 [Gemmatimonadales bacterium]
MRSFAIVLALLLLPSTWAPPRAQAQDIGAVIDWIHRLSGPSMLGGAVSVAHPLGSERVRGRLQLAYRVAVASDDRIEPDGASVTMFTIRPGVEIPLFWYLELNSGIAFNRFGGDADEGFWKASFPVLAQLRIPLGEGRWMLRAGAGLEYFPKFSEGDFDPIDVSVKTEEGEFAGAFMIGFDWAIGSR